MYKCKTCKLELGEENYYFNTHRGRNHACKECIKKSNREKYNTPGYKEARKIRSKIYLSNPENVEKNKTRGDKHYRSIRGRALSLFNAALNRSIKYSDPIGIDLEFILEKLKSGVCDATGLPFDLGKPIGTVKNPYAPSVDRKNSQLGYTRENTQIVIWQYNLMKGEISEQELLSLCKLIVERYSVNAVG